MKIIICSTCDGTGKHWEDFLDDSIHPVDRDTRFKKVICGRCKGSGRLIKTIIFEPYEESSSK